MTNKTKVIIHCSDSEFGNAAIINEWHRQRGFYSVEQNISIGYHLVILNGKISARCYNPRFDGRIETGRGFDEDNHIERWEHGAHTKGQNYSSLGICLIGKSGDFTNAQIRGLSKELRELRIQFGQLDIGQHSDYSKSKPFCAGFTEKQMRELKRIGL